MAVQQVALLDFPWVLDYILATRFNGSLKQIRHAVCSIVLTLRTILSAAVELGILVSQDVGSIDGAISAKPFIDNMIYVITECLQSFPLCLDSEFFHSFLEPLPSHLKFLCGNFHPLTHMKFADAGREKAFDTQQKAITQALSELPSQCSHLETYMSSQEPVLKQIHFIKEHLRAPLWMLMHDFRSLHGEEKMLVSDVREAVRMVTESMDVEFQGNTWADVMGETLLLLLPLWKLSALAVAKGQEAYMRMVAAPPLDANVGAQRLLQRLIEVLLSEKADFLDVAQWFASEPSSAALLSSSTSVDFLLPEAANDEEFTQFRQSGLLRVQENVPILQSHLVRLPKHQRNPIAARWRKVVEEVHLYLQLYLRVIDAFLDVQKEVRSFVQTHLFIEVTLGLPLMTWLSDRGHTGPEPRYRGGERQLLPA